MSGRVTYMDTDVIEKIKSLFPDNSVMEKESMKRHTTFRAGGEAALFVEIENTKQLRALLRILVKNAIPYFIKGNGSNLLVSDSGYQGVIIELGSQYSKVTIDGREIHAMAGTLLSKVAKCACEAGLSGMEFASGIPGTVGGAMVMNAGAYDGEMKQIVKEVTLLMPDDSICTYTGEQMQFGYRTSILKQKPFIVLETVFTLQDGDIGSISAKMADYAARRKEKQPLEYPSAGSTFKRPEGYFAGKLIMDSGLRGYSVGGAQVSEKHCGFVINKGNATASDIYRLMQDVQKKVQDKTGIVLEPEVITLGEF